MTFNHKPSILLFIFIIISILLLQTNQKIVRKTITLRQLAKQKLIFVTRFDFGVGQNNITVKHKKNRAENSQIHSTRIGLLSDQNYDKYQNATTCQEKQQLFFINNPIRFFDSQYGTQIVRLDQEKRENSWFVYVYNCQGVPLRGGDGSQEVNFEFILMNSGSHLGQDQKLLWPYVLLFIAWIGALGKSLLKPMLRAIIEPKTQFPKIILLFSYMLLGLGVFYRIINLITIHYSGETIVIFDMLHGAFKNTAQGAILTLLLSISWGWSLTYLQYQTKYKIVAVVVTILHVVCVILWHYTQQIQNSYHQYQQTAGILVLIIRIVLSIVFVIGCLSIQTKSVGKRKYFIRKFMKFGSLYLFSWPAAVILCQIFVPKYLHNQIIIIIQQYTHLIANAYICWLYIHPDSEYQQVNIKKNQDKESLPQYKIRK